MHFLQKRKIHVKNLSYRVEIKSNIVILLINQGISGIFHKLTNEKKCAIISKLIRKNNVFEKAVAKKKVNGSLLISSSGSDKNEYINIAEKMSTVISKI